MTIDKQLDGNYTITDNRKTFPNFSPMDVFCYIKNYLIGDETDIRTMAINPPEHPEEVATRTVSYATRRADIERQTDGKVS